MASNDSDAADDDDECEGVAYMFDAAAATERLLSAEYAAELAGEVREAVAAQKAIETVEDVHTCSTHSAPLS